MAHLHCRTRIHIRILNPVTTLHCTEHVHIAQTRIPTSYFCVGQELY